ncbi:MAG TPA: hypothetical protein VKW78_23250 [Terriglobales bacterium]|nr:hypothetical protein [Terriglobales bacterium]
MRAQVILICFLAATALWAANSTKTYTGRISDSQCALNIHSKTHSHTEMLQGGHMGKDPADCARMCVREMGGAYVLITKTAIYKLDDQKAADAFVGKSVKVAGTLDAANHMLHVVSMKAAE